MLTPKPDELLTTGQASAMLGRSPHTLRTYRVCGPKFSRVNGRVRYARSDLEAWQADRSTSTEVDPELLETLALLADTVALLLGRRIS